jgi:GAF domain-containing protein
MSSNFQDSLDVSDHNQSCEEKLQRTIQHQKILSRILAKIRTSVELEALCSTSCQDIGQELELERVTLYRFHENWSGSFVNNYGFAKSPWDTLKTFGANLVWEDTHLQETKGGRYSKNEPYAVADIYHAGHSRCHIELLEQFQVRAYALAPIFVGTKIWGLLAAYQHSAPRQWDRYEIEFLSQAGANLGIAIQQTEITKRWQRETAKLRALTEERTAQLENAVARQRALTEVVGNIRSSLDPNLIFDTTCNEVCKLIKVERTAIYRFNEDWSGEFISNFSTVDPHWSISDKIGQNMVWEDTHLQETRGGRYRNNETFAVADIYQAEYSRCHLDILEQYKIRAYALAPIFVGKNLWGLLAVYQHSETREWADYEVEFLAQTSAQLGVAMQQAEILKQSKQQRIALENSIARQRTLTEVVSKIRSSLDTELILETTCQEVCKLLKVERVAVYHFNEDWSGEFISQYGISEPQWITSFPFGQNIVWEDTHLQDTKGGRYRNNETFAVADVYKAGHSRCHLDILEQFKIRAYALAPIFVGRTLWGLLAAYQHSTTRQWEKVEVEFLAQAAGQLGVAIQSSNLLSQTQIRAEELQQSAAERQILFDVVAKIRESLDLETIFKTMVQEVRRSLKADRVGVFRFDNNSNYHSGEFVAEDVLQNFPPALGAKLEDHRFSESYASQYTKGKVQVLADINNAQLSDCYQEMLESFQIKAQMIIPLLEGERLWGLLCIHQCTRSRKWEEAELEFAKQVAAQLSVALRQANLLNQTREQKDKLTQTLNDLQKAQLQIIQSEKMASLGQLVAGVAHEINNPVNFIYGNLEHASEYTKELINCIQLYQKHYPEPVKEIQDFLKKAEIGFLFKDIPNIFQSMQTGTNRILEIVMTLRNFSRLDEADFKKVDIHDGIDSTLMILQNRLKPFPESAYIQVIKDYGKLPLVECYPGQLNQVFMNLMANAIDALEEHNQKRTPEEIKANPSKIKISTSVNNKDWITISITDNANGIPEELQSHLFEPFFTTKSVGKGTGLGLSISYQIVCDKHGGKLYCNSAIGKGTEFVIEIPARQNTPAT